jgi:hypothetical protein
MNGWLSSGARRVDTRRERCGYGHRDLRTPDDRDLAALAAVPEFTAADLRAAGHSIDTVAEDAWNRWAE